MYHINLIVRAPYFINLNNNKTTLFSENAIILCSFTFTAKENRKVISSYQIYSAAISTLLF